MHICIIFFLFFFSLLNNILVDLFENVIINVYFSFARATRNNLLMFLILFDLIDYFYDLCISTFKYFIFFGKFASRVHNFNVIIYTLNFAKFYIIIRYEKLYRNSDSIKRGFVIMSIFYFITNRDRNFFSVKFVYFTDYSCVAPVSRKRKNLNVNRSLISTCHTATANGKYLTVFA